MEDVCRGCQVAVCKGDAIGEEYLIGDEPSRSVGGRVGDRRHDGYNFTQYQRRAAVSVANGTDDGYGIGFVTPFNKQPRERTGAVLF